MARFVDLARDKRGVLSLNNFENVRLTNGEVADLLVFLLGWGSVGGLRLRRILRCRVGSLAIASLACIVGSLGHLARCISCPLGWFISTKNFKVCRL